MKKVKTEKDHEYFLLYEEWRELFQDAYGISLRQVPCSSCDYLYPHAHHVDYRFPLKLKWLCVFCHTSLHRKILNGYADLIHADGAHEKVLWELELPRILNDRIIL